MYRGGRNGEKNMGKTLHIKHARRGPLMVARFKKYFSKHSPCSTFRFLRLAIRQEASLPLFGSTQTGV